MGKNSAIEWTHHTFNPWRGCTKISPGCAHCYAERLSVRNPAVLGIWGDDGTRPIGSDAYWRQPLAWDAAAAAAGERHRVFCASLADVFEDRPELNMPRQRLFRTIQETPSLDWLLLTKRPEVAAEYSATLAARRNIWLGVSVENVRQLGRVHLLQQLPVRVRFLSVEPLLGAICNLPLGLIDWVIAGGESGPDARPMHPDWARGIRDQCIQAGVPFFFKQWGEFGPTEGGAFAVTRVGGDEIVCFGRVGRVAAGRLLDGREWSEFPAVAGLRELTSAAADRRFGNAH